MIKINLKKWEFFYCLNLYKVQQILLIYTINYHNYIMSEFLRQQFNW